jgi:hypothetical protein
MIIRGRPIIKVVYGGSRLVWEKGDKIVQSCYANGTWQDQFIWTDNTIWSD